MTATELVIMQQTGAPAAPSAPATGRAADGVQEQIREAQQAAQQAAGDAAREATRRNKSVRIDKEGWLKWSDWPTT